MSNLSLLHTTPDDDLRPAPAIFKLDGRAHSLTPRCGYPPPPRATHSYVDSSKRPRIASSPSPSKTAVSSKVKGSSSPAEWHPRRRSRAVRLRISHRDAWRRACSGGVHQTATTWVTRGRSRRLRATAVGQGPSRFASAERTDLSGLAWAPLATPHRPREWTREDSERSARRSQFSCTTSGKFRLTRRTATREQLPLTGCHVTPLSFALLL